MKKVFVIGSLNIDIVFTVNHLPKMGETLKSTNFMISEGGKGNNQAIALAKQNANVYMVGSVGNDEFGKRLINVLNENKVNTDYLNIVNKNTGIASIYLFEGDNQIVLDSGANYEITKEQIDNSYNAANPGDLVVLQLEIPIDIVEYALMKANEKNLVTILNPAPATKLKEEMYKYIDFIIPNEIESYMLTNQEELNDRIDYFKNLGVKNVIITLGDKGVIYSYNNIINQVNAFKVKAIDTTAAGDTFVGILTASLANNLEFEVSLKRAIAGSAISVTRLAAQNSIPTKLEINEFLNKNN